MASREERARARRRVFRRRRQVAAAGLLLFCTLTVMAGVRLAAALTNGPVAVAGVGSPAPAGLVVRPAVSTPMPPTSSSTGSSPKSSASALLGSSTAVWMRPAAWATGLYVRASGGTARHGSGTLRTYRVEVETGTGESARVFAAAVDATLANAASWTGQGLWSLQRVDTDDADFVIRLAIPATVDEVCAAAGLDTRGYVSCRSGHFVMINLDRWLGAVTEYQGNVALYRQYVINHEVGHELGYGHQACPAPGRPAPVMQQQTLGLKGCLVNGWPYIDGKLVSGPAAA